MFSYNSEIGFFIEVILDSWGSLEIQVENSNKSREAIRSIWPTAKYNRVEHESAERCHKEVNDHDQKWVSLDWRAWGFLVQWEAEHWWEYIWEWLEFV
jgi:hypothetical protein